MKLPKEVRMELCFITILSLIIMGTVTFAIYKTPEQVEAGIKTFYQRCESGDTYKMRRSDSRNCIAHLLSKRTK